MSFTVYQQAGGNPPPTLSGDGGKVIPPPPAPPAPLRTSAPRCSLSVCFPSLQAQAQGAVVLTNFLPLLSFPPGLPCDLAGRLPGGSACTHPVLTGLGACLALARGVRANTVEAGPAPRGASSWAPAFGGRRRACSAAQRARAEGRLDQGCSQRVPAPGRPDLQACVLVCAQSGVSDSTRAPGPQPTRLLCLWGLSGKNTGVGCHILLWGSSRPRG